MLLLLARHGQSSANTGEILNGDDPGLTQIGWEQVKLLARRIVDEQPIAIYAGPHPRTLQTLEAVRYELPLTPFVHPLFCEHWSVGCEGWPRWRLQETFPWVDFPEAITDQPWWPPVPESEHELFMRATRAIQLIRERHTDAREKVLLLGQNTFGAALISVILGLPPCNYSRFLHRNGSVSLIDLWDNGAQIYYLNDVSHLPKHLWT